MAEYHRVDSDDLTPGVQERSARVSWREGDVRSHVARGGAPARPAKLSHATHDADAHGPDPAPGMADSVDQFADAQGVRVPDGGCRQISVVAFQPEQREVQAL